MRALLLSLALVAAPAGAELTITRPGLIMRLQSAPCEDPSVLSHIADKYHDQFRRMVVNLNSRPERGCWIDEGETVVLYFADGSNGRLPKEAFTDDPGI